MSFGQAAPPLVTLTNHRRQYKNQPPQLSHAGKEQPTWLNWWLPLAARSWKRALLTTNGKQLCTHNTETPRNSEYKTPKIWSTDDAKYQATKEKNTKG